MARRRRPPAGGGTPRLFESADLRLRRTGEARLRDLARLPVRPLSQREARAEEETAVIERLRGWGTDLASRFGLRFASLEAEQEGVNEHFGVCYQDGVIRIRLRHAVTGRLLKESSHVDTLCHELAHLRHFDHSEKFRRLYQRILGEARRLGYYRPGTVGGERPTQGSLFNGCGVGRGGETDSRRRGH